MTIGDRLGQGGRSRVGVGVPVTPDQVPQPFSIVHNDWRSGYVSIESDEDTDASASPMLQDIESRYADSLVRAPGIAELEDVAPHSLQWLFEHAALGYLTELVAIDPPYIGVKASGAFVWTDEGISPTSIWGWRVVNVGGFLIFSNGSDATYMREFGTGTITDLSTEVIATTFANSFGRCFAGSYTDPVDGLVGLGVKWNASTDDPADWSGLGSGNQLLITNQPEADIIISMRPIGFDVIGIVCRKNLWLGYPTGDPNEPADFRVRFPGIGGVSDRCTVVTPLGIITLDDRGVVLFDINQANIISGPINNKLIPLDYTQLTQYFAVYNPVLHRYQLYTPAGVWIWDMPVGSGGALVPPSTEHPGRWYFRGYYPASDASAAIFVAQSSNVFWNTVQGTWNAQQLTWNEMAIGETDAPALVLVGDTGILGYENDGTQDYFGTPQDPFWTAKQDAKHVTDLITSESFEIEFITLDNTAELLIERLDENGTTMGSTAFALPNTMGSRVKRIWWAVMTGQGTSFRLSIAAGTPEIFSVRHTMSQSGPTLQAVG